MLRPGVPLDLFLSSNAMPQPWPKALQGYMAMWGVVVPS